MEKMRIDRFRGYLYLVPVKFEIVAEVGQTKKPPENLRTVLNSGLCKYYAKITHHGDSK